MRYRKIDPRIWNDEKFGKLSDKGKLAFLFLLTHRGMTALGAMRASWAGLAAELRWTLRRWTDAITPAVRLGMVEVNHERAYVGLPHWLRYNAPDTPNVVKGAWLTAMHLLPECPERRALAERCLAYLEAASADFRRAIGDSTIDAIRETISESIQERMPESIPESTPGPFPHPGAGAVTGAVTTPLPPSRGNGAAPPETTPFTPQDLKDLWNQYAQPPMQKSLGLAGQRLTHAKARLKEHPEREFWDGLVRRFAASSFVQRGGTDGAWRPGIDFLLKSENVFKVLEGRFDDDAPPPRRRAQTVDLDQHVRDVRALGERGSH